MKAFPAWSVRRIVKASPTAGALGKAVAKLKVPCCWVEVLTVSDLPLSAPGGESQRLSDEGISCRLGRPCWSTSWC